MNKKIDLEKFYTKLKAIDSKILSKFSQPNISDEDYFYFGILNDIASNALNIVVNILCDNEKSNGIDINCRMILEALLTFELNKNSQISSIQKKIYRYSYSLVELSNFKLIIKNEDKNNPLLRKIFEDKKICLNLLMEHFKCNLTALKNIKFSSDDPCIYLKNNLTEKISFIELLKKNNILNGYAAKYYRFFSVIVHPRCGLSEEDENIVLNLRMKYTNEILNFVFDMLTKIFSNIESSSSFEQDFIKNPLLLNNVENLNVINEAFGKLKIEWKTIDSNKNILNHSFIDKIQHILIDMNISQSLGYKEHVIALFRIFLEEFAIFWEINSKTDLDKFNYYVQGYFVSSQCQIIQAIKTEINDYKEKENKIKLQLRDLYDSFYKNEYNLSSFECFDNDIQLNSLRFIRNARKSFTYHIRNMLNSLLNNKEKNDNIYTLYKISNDMCHAGGYSFNASLGMIIISSILVNIATYELMIIFLLNLSQSNSINTIWLVQMFKILIAMYEKEYLNQNQMIMKRIEKREK